MNGHSLVAVYESRAVAERARDRLLQLGIPATDIRLSAETGTDRALERDDRLAVPETERRGGFWDWLFGEDVPAHDRSWYETHLRGGRTAVSVLVRDDAEVGRATDILEEFDPIDLDQTAQMPMAEPGIAARTGPVTASSMGERQVPPMEPGVAYREAGASAGVGEATAATGAGRVSAEGEQVIPVVKEELDVGKRTSERRYRIRTYVVERPVETPVHLRDERVVIEHRPVAGDRMVSEGEFPKEREVEVVERREEPVVTKRRAEEDIVVRKEAEERTEVVRDTVRETKVDIDRDAKLDRD